MPLSIQRKTVKRFIGCLCRRGNKIRAERIFADITDALRRSIKETPTSVLMLVLSTFRPHCRLFSKKVGGTSYKLPILLTEIQSYSVAVHWLIENAEKRSEKNITERVLCEIMDTFQGKNQTLIKKRDEIHKIALLNRPFLRFK